MFYLRINKSLQLLIIIIWNIQQKEIHFIIKKDFILKTHRFKNFIISKKRAYLNPYLYNITKDNILKIILIKFSTILIVIKRIIYLFQVII